MEHVERKHLSCFLYSSVLFQASAFGQCWKQATKRAFNSDAGGFTAILRSRLECLTLNSVVITVKIDKY